MWSEERLPGGLEATAFARELERRREAVGEGLVDLTLSNPTKILGEHREAMAEAWRAAAEEAGSRAYAPEPAGLREAREAISGYYADRGAEVPGERILVTASTSEAYSWLGKVFADPGDEILIPTPSYPLFEHLLRLESVGVRRYRHRFDGRWHVDTGDVRRQLEEGNPAAVFAVSPNNPTGDVLSDAALEDLAEMCARHGVPLVVDEVFVDFGLDDESPRPVAGRLEAIDDPPLVVTLSGLSKTAALPGVKLGWMALAGPDELCDEAARRLEFVADQFLSASTASQLVAPRVLGELGAFHDAVERRTRGNLETLREAVGEVGPCDVHPAECGWYAVVRAPRFVEDAEFCLELVSEAGVVVQPGFFYEFRGGTRFVVGLLAEAGAFERGARGLVEHLEKRVG